MNVEFTRHLLTIKYVEMFVSSIKLLERFSYTVIMSRHFLEVRGSNPYYLLYQINKGRKFKPIH